MVASPRMLAISCVSTNGIRLRESMSCRSEGAIAPVYQNVCAISGI